MKFYCNFPTQIGLLNKLLPTEQISDEFPIFFIFLR